MVDCPLAEALAERLRAARTELTERWLNRISERASVDPDRVFPSAELLDHVPLLMDGIADYVEDSADEIGADDTILAKAMELGELRHAQGFAAHEILKEYEILGGVLFTFLIRVVGDIEQECSRAELLTCAHRLFRAITVIQQVTTTHYLRLAEEGVREREERLRGFNRLVTHELKNRITAAGGATDMLREPWVAGDEGQRARFLAIVAQNVRGMEVMLQDILQLTRTDHDERAQHHVELPAVAMEAARQLREMAEEKGVVIRIADDLPPVEVDSAAVELCLVNYISNGIKYADPEKAERWVEVRGHGADGEGELVVEVHDNGVGVPPERRAQLFERFYRAHEGALDVEGTGLGLNIVRETMASIRGRAWAEFDRPEGSVFKIALPEVPGAQEDEDVRITAPEVEPRP